MSARRTRVKNVGQDGHHTELVLLTRLLGDVLTDDLGPADGDRDKDLAPSLPLQSRAGVSQ